MKIPCVCAAGSHSLTAHEMVAVIGAFQRGELSKVRYQGGQITGVIPVCVMNTDFEAGPEKYTGPCNVEMADGTQCRLPRGHKHGRHGTKPKSSRNALRAVS